MSVTNQPKPHDTREAIFKRLFRCRIRDIDTMSTDYMRELGVPYSGDLKDSMQALKAPVLRYFTINQMLEYFRKGIPFNVIDYADTAAIYEAINDHLMAWKQELEHSYDARHAPLQDLVDLDKFANVVYDKARFVFNHGFIESRTVRGFNNLFEKTIGIGDIFASLFEPAREQAEVDPEDPYAHLPKRTSLEDIFAARLD